MEDLNLNCSNSIPISKRNLSESDNIVKTSCIKWRYVTAILSFWAMLNSFWINGLLSVAIVSMTQPREGAKIDVLHSFSNHSNGSHFVEGVGNTEQVAAEFEWHPQIQGILLGGFFWGLLFMQAVSGVLVDRFGVKKMHIAGAACSAAGMFLGPVAARTHVYLFIATRLLSGIGGSVEKPVFITVVASWYHPHERSRFMAFIFSGGMSGMSLSMILTGYLCNTFPSEGWKWSFYCPGLSIATQLVLWTFLVYGTPREHPWISDEERTYIESQSNRAIRKSRDRVIPWTDICKSKPVWAIVANAFGQGWGFYTLMTQMPTFMKTILGFDMRQSGIFASLPYIVSVFVNNGSSVAADYLLKSKILRVVTIRNIFSIAGTLPCGLTLLAVTFVDSDPATIYVLLVVGMATVGFVNSGSLINQIDLAPNYVGVLQGIIGSSMSISGISCSYLAGFILESDGSVARWNFVFYITSGILIGSVVFYVIFSEGELQHWNNNVNTTTVKPESAISVTVSVVRLENGGTTLTKLPDDSVEMIKAC